MNYHLNHSIKKKLLSSKSEIKALEQLFKTFQSGLVSFAYRMVYNEEDAREIVQDVFMGVWRNRAKLDLNEGLKSYLFTATKNKALNHLKKKKEETVELEAVSYGLAASPSTDSEAQLQAEEMKAIIFDEVNKLPDRCRQIFLLSREEGLSYKEIAERLDVSSKTVENQIGIALKRLKERVYGKRKDISNRGLLLEWSLILLFSKNAATFGGILQNNCTAL
jgi:RNA polymerase sigma-70 factor (ECF subfamily)